jgi:hypothetical protein
MEAQNFVGTMDHNSQGGQIGKAKQPIHKLVNFIPTSIK